MDDDKGRPHGKLVVIDLGLWKELEEFEMAIYL